MRTTHVGSLPRPQDVVDLLFAEDRGDPVDPAAYDRTMVAAVVDVVRRQLDAGVDLVSDGEMSKISYATYVRHRLTGFAVAAPGDYPRTPPRDLDEFPEFRDRIHAAGATPQYLRPVCVGPVASMDLAGLHADLRRLTDALANHGLGPDRAFVNAASPGVIPVFHPNIHYRTYEDYLGALSDAMRPEYEAIVAAGFTLQVDCPDLALGRHMAFRDLDDEAFLAKVELNVQALDAALADVPRDRVRMHVCWGNYEGPHIHDIPAETILPIVLKAKPQAILFEAANPRHAHEWTAWADAGPSRSRPASPTRPAALPNDAVLVPGVIDTTTNFVEHPELVAQRLARFVDIVGPDRVMAGTDCGFGTFAGYGAVHPTICWPKLRALSDGTALATDRLARR